MLALFSGGSGATVPVAAHSATVCLGYYHLILTTVKIAPVRNHYHLSNTKILVVWSASMVI